MSGEPLTCPYCNAQVTVGPGTKPGQRIPCLLCGESFPLAGFTTAPTASTAEPAPAPPEPPPPRRSNRLVAGIVLGVMAAAAAVGLTFALLTEKDRRAHDTRLPKQNRRPLRSPDLSEAEAPAPVATQHLAALGYLPPNTTGLVGVRVSELLAGPEGQALLNEPLRAGDAAFRLDQLAAWTGLRPQDLDHAVLGVQVDAALPYRPVLVVRTREPYDADKVRTALHARPLRPAGGRALDEVRPSGLAVPLILWRPDEHTLVFGLDADSLREVPATPAADLAALAPELREVLRERIDPAAPIWLAGTSRDWSDSAARWLLRRDLDRLKQVETVAAWVRGGRPLTVQAVIRGKDEAAARAVEEWLRTLPEPAGGERKTARAGAWVTVQWRTDPAGLGRLLAP